MDRKPLSDTRPGYTRRFELAYTHKDGKPDLMGFYFTVNMYEDGKPGEIFVKADKPGTLAAGVLDAFAIMASMALQYGVPLKAITDKIKNTRFNPSGYTKDPEIPSCSSPLDLLARWLEIKFPNEYPKE